jgi:hypothetical protein
MARIRIVPDKDEMQLVLKIIQDRLGCQVSDYPSLIVFMNAIEQSVIAPVLSPNTWRRLFGLMKNDHSPTITTLNILAQHASFASWFDFVHSNSRETDRALSHIVGHYASGNLNQIDVADIFKETGPSAHFYRMMQHVLTISFTRRNTSFIGQLYSDANYFPFDLNNRDAVYEEFNLHQLVGVYCIQLKHPGYYSALKQSPFGLKKVLELCVNYGESASMYIELMRFAQSEHIFNEADLFPSSVLAYNALLCGDLDELKIQAAKFVRYLPKENTLLLCGRIRVCQWFLKFGNLGIIESEVLKQVEEDHHVFCRITNQSDAFSFYLLYVIRYLCSIGAFTLIIQIVTKYYPQGPLLISFWSKVIWNRLAVYISEAKFQLNHQKEAEKWMKKIKPELFDTFQYHIDLKKYQYLQGLKN